MIPLLVLLIVAIGTTWRFPLWHTFACWCVGFVGYGTFVEPTVSDSVVSYGWFAAFIYAPIGLIIVMVRR